MKYLIRWGDIAGFAASALCLVHCLALPLVFAAFPMLGLAGAHGHFHDILVIGVTIPVLVALLPGFIVHRDPTALALGALGLGLFLLAVYVAGPRFGHGWETALAVASSVLLLTAHWCNHRRNHRHNHPHHAQGDVHCERC